MTSTPPRSGKTYIANLEYQLQVYKDKEDKIRELLKNREADIFKGFSEKERHLKFEIHRLKCEILSILDLGGE